MRFDDACLEILPDWHPGRAILAEPSVLMSSYLNLLFP